MHEPLNWAVDGIDWPHREASRFVDAAGLHWHVQRFGDSGAPLVLLIHGTGASAHSWRDVAPGLVPQFDVFTLDLPGHGFTSMPRDGAVSALFSLNGMADALGELLHVLGEQPAVVAGHSSGAALAAIMCLRGVIKPLTLLSFNGAFFPLGGWSGRLISPLTKAFAQTPLVPRLFSAQAGHAAVLHRLLDRTGSTLDAAGIALYRRLVSNPSHAAGALGMMANWDLYGLPRKLAELKMPLHLVVGSNDGTVSPGQAERLRRALAPPVTVGLTCLEGLGHLAHEEQPRIAAELIQKQYANAVQHQATQ